MTFSRLVGALALLVAFQVSLPSVAAADEVLDWNTIALRALYVPPAVPAFLQQRSVAIVHVSMFDALEGIEHRYQPIHVDSSSGPRNASRRAAVVQAAYRALVGQFTPAKAAALALDSELAASLAEIAKTESSPAIQSGRDWGDKVALAILDWRKNDNPAPLTPYIGSLEVGKWRPTPGGPDPMNPGKELPGNPGAGPLLGNAQPFVLPSASLFRTEGPPDLKSREYATDVNEVKRVGEFDSVYRTADQTESANFWQGAAASVWNRGAQTGSLRRHFNLSQNARLFALLNVAMADAIFRCWDTKYYYSFWRPITAIRLADLDSNPRTTADPTWVPLIVTPAFPEYDSGHQSVSSSAAEVLTSFFGNRLGFESISEPLGPDVVRSWRNFWDAAEEAGMARIWAGIHYRFSITDAGNASRKLAQYVLKHAAEPVRDKHQ